MIKRNRLEMEAMDRVDVFGKRADVTFTPRQILLFTTIGSNLATLRHWGEGQISGLQTQSAGTEQRRDLARDILSRLRDIADVAKSMEEEGNMGMAELFRYPRKPTHEALILVAESFAERAAGMDAEFIERSLPSTFVTDLQAKITAFRAATAMKNTGKADRSAGTAGLHASAAAGMKAIRMLRPIMRLHLKSAPALRAAWILAARVERPAKTAAARADKPADQGAAVLGERADIETGAATDISPGIRQVVPRSAVQPPEFLLRSPTASAFQLPASFAWPRVCRESSGYRKLACGSAGFLTCVGGIVAGGDPETPFGIH